MEPRDTSRALAGSGAAFLGAEMAKIVVWNLGLLQGPIPSDIVSAITNLCVAVIVYFAVWLPVPGGKRGR
jgi:hypothetical protein